MCICVSHVEHPHVKTNLIHQLYWVQAIGSLPIESFKNLLTNDQYKKCVTKMIVTWYSLTRDIFLDYLYNISPYHIFISFINQIFTC